MVRREVAWNHDAFSWVQSGGWALLFAMFVALAGHYSWHFPIPVPNSNLIRTTELVEKDVSTSVISVNTSSRVFDHSLLSTEQVVSDLSSLDLPLVAHPSNRKNNTKQHTLPEHSGSSDCRADLSYSSSSTPQILTSTASHLASQPTTIRLFPHLPSTLPLASLSLSKAPLCKAHTPCPGLNSHAV
ncbi:hypothetical protein HDK64DRAFT_251719 [Phyllosticta capitalensis]